MPIFQAFIHGVNFHMRALDSESAESLGFYVVAYVEAASPGAAELASIQLLRATPRLREAVTNPAADPPRMFVEEIQELAEWPTDRALPLSGLVFYKESDRDEPEAAAA